MSLHPGTCKTGAWWGRIAASRCWFGSSLRAVANHESVSCGPFPLQVGNDWFLLANDFASYLDAQNEVNKTYKDQSEWLRRWGGEEIYGIQIRNLLCGVAEWDLDPLAIRNGVQRRWTRGRGAVLKGTARAHV